MEGGYGYARSQKRRERCEGSSLWTTSQQVTAHNSPQIHQVYTSPNPLPPGHLPLGLHHPPATPPPASEEEPIPESFLGFAAPHWFARRLCVVPALVFPTPSPSLSPLPLHHQQEGEGREVGRRRCLPRPLPHPAMFRCMRQWEVMNHLYPQPQNPGPAFQL